MGESKARLRCLRPATAVLALAALLIAPASIAQAREDPTFRVRELQPRVQYFADFTYDRVIVSGGTSSVRESLQRSIHRFVMPWVNYYLRPDRETREYLRRARPAYFSSNVTLTPDCRSGYVCVSQGTTFNTRLIATTVTGIQARAWVLGSGAPADLRRFVAPSELPEFTRRVKRAVERSNCYYGFGVDLKPQYESFPDWVPVDGGIRLWFPEYQFACVITEVVIPWR